MANAGNTGIGTGTAQVATMDRTLAALNQTLGKVDARAEQNRLDGVAKKKAKEARLKKIQDEVNGEYSDLKTNEPWARDNPKFYEMLKEYKDLSNSYGKSGYNDQNIRREMDDKGLEMRKFASNSINDKAIAKEKYDILFSAANKDNFTQEDRDAYDKAIMTPGFDMNQVSTEMVINLPSVDDWADKVFDNDGQTFYIKSEGGSEKADGSSYTGGSSNLDVEKYKAAYMSRYNESVASTGAGRKLATAIFQKYGEAAEKAGMDVGEYAFQEDLKRRILKKDITSDSVAAKKEEGSNNNGGVGNPNNLSLNVKPLYKKGTSNVVGKSISPVDKNGNPVNINFAIGKKAYKGDVDRFYTINKDGKTKYYVDILIGSDSWEDMNEEQQKEAINDYIDVFNAKQTSNKNKIDRHKITADEQALIKQDVAKEVNTAARGTRKRVEITSKPSIMEKLYGGTSIKKLFNPNDKKSEGEVDKNGIGSKY